MPAIALGTKYYVYGLFDPRDGVLFYVGKGCGSRLESHALCPDGSCPNAHARVREIQAEGFEPVALYLANGLTEQEALEKESALILLHGRQGFDTGGTLTNIAVRGSSSRTAGSTIRREANEHLGKILKWAPFTLDELTRLKNLRVEVSHPNETPADLLAICALFQEQMSLLGIKSQSDWFFCLETNRDQLLPVIRDFYRKRTGEELPYTDDDIVTTWIRFRKFTDEHKDEVTLPWVAHTD